MTVEEAKELLKEYDVEWQRLLKKGERRWGLFCGFRTDAGEYADSKIKKHSRYSLWEQAHEVIAKKDRVDYEKYCQSFPLVMEGDPEQQLVQAMGHYTAFRVDRRAREKILALAKNNHIL